MCVFVCLLFLLLPISSDEEDLAFRIERLNHVAMRELKKCSGRNRKLQQQQVGLRFVIARVVVGVFAAGNVSLSTLTLSPHTLSPSNTYTYHRSMRRSGS